MAKPLDIFLSRETQTFLNPKLPEGERQRLLDATRDKNLTSHVWLMSSGTESSTLSSVKMIALSKDAILAAAQAVVREFQLGPKDIYLNALPDFHIAGLSVWARAFIAGLKVHAIGEWTWDVNNFVSRVEELKITVSSLVPTQVYDLVKAQKKAPRSVRHIFVGGGALSPTLWEQACELGWPLVLSYGMTETCAMIAVGNSPEVGLRKLSHVVDWAHDENERLKFLSPALLTGYLFVPREGLSEFVDPKIKGWYQSDDCGRIENHRLFLQGREAELVKINGESVSITAIQGLWDNFALQHQLPGTSYIVALPHERQGFQLALLSREILARELTESFNQSLLAFQRIQKVYRLRDVPLSPLGKLLRGKVLAQLELQRPEYSF